MYIKEDLRGKEMCKYCQAMQPILRFSQTNKGRRNVKTYIGIGYKKSGKTFRCLTTELETDGEKTACSMEIHFCPVCGRKLSEVSE